MRTLGYINMIFVFKFDAIKIIFFARSSSRAFFSAHLFEAYDKPVSVDLRVNRISAI